MNSNDKIDDQQPLRCGHSRSSHPNGNDRSTSLSPRTERDQQSTDASAPHSVDSEILVSVVMPCLNESRTLRACIEAARDGCQTALEQRRTRVAAGEQNSIDCIYAGTPNDCQPQPGFEIIIADNGSTDGSQKIAREYGAMVVAVEQKGYGAALLGGIAVARGRYIVMGDADRSYDFGEVRRFLEQLDEGFDLVIGNRFTGNIEPGAMPWHHRYIGNPILSGIGRFLYRTPCRDWHCGLRAFDREKINDLKLKSTGMEFASEMVLRTAQAKLRIKEIPITLHPDGRKRPPHLRSVRDGCRHLHMLVSLSWLRSKRARGLVNFVGLLIAIYLGVLASGLWEGKTSYGFSVLEGHFYKDFGGAVGLVAARRGQNFSDCYWRKTASVSQWAFLVS